MSGNSAQYTRSTDDDLFESSSVNVLIDSKNYSKSKRLKIFLVFLLLVFLTLFVLCIFSLSPKSSKKIDQALKHLEKLGKR